MKEPQAEEAAEKLFAGHGPAPQKLQVIDPPLWGGAMRCQKSIMREFFSNLWSPCHPASENIGEQGGTGFSL